MGMKEYFIGKIRKYLQSYNLHFRILDFNISLDFCSSKTIFLTRFDDRKVITCFEK